jgi:hypothetical protein
VLPSPVELTFQLSRRQRVLWSLGSPFRAICVFGVTAVVCWLGLVTIGWSAVRVVSALVLSGHWFSYAIAGRSRLSFTAEGIYDHTRFAKRHFAWADMNDLRAATPVRHLHGLVFDHQDRNGSLVRFLRASWRPSLSEVETILDRATAAGWPVRPD